MGYNFTPSEGHTRKSADGVDWPSYGCGDTPCGQHLEVNANVLKDNPPGVTVHLMNTYHRIPQDAPNGFRGPFHKSNNPVWNESRVLAYVGMKGPPKEGEKE